MYIFSYNNLKTHTNDPCEIEILAKEQIKISS